MKNIKALTQNELLEINGGTTSKYDIWMILPPNYYHLQESSYKKGLDLRGVLNTPKYSI